MASSGTRKVIPQSAEPCHPEEEYSFWSDCGFGLSKMKYQIAKKRLSGIEIVKYACAGCNSTLWSPLADGGKSDTCPDCAMTFVIPGSDELERRTIEEIAESDSHFRIAHKDSEWVAQRKAEKKIELAQKMASRKEAILRDIESGRSFFMYRSIFLPVDSTIDNKAVGSFSIKILQGAGADGWRVVAVVPQTSGITLENISVGSTLGQTYGGGLGGTISGVYVLMQKELRAADIAIEAEDELSGYLRALDGEDKSY